MTLNPEEYECTWVYATSFSVTASDAGLKSHIALTFGEMVIIPMLKCLLQDQFD